MAGITPLHFCIFRGDNEQAISLIERGESDLDAGDSGGQTPCHIASYRDNVVVMKKLVEAGADPAKADKSGNTPMHAAAVGGAKAVLEYFVQKGVPAVKNIEGLTPLDLAQRHCPPKTRAAVLAMLEKHAAASNRAEQQQDGKQEEDEESRQTKAIELERLQQQQQQQQQRQQQQQPVAHFLQLPSPPSPTSAAGNTPRSAVPAVGRGKRRPLGGQGNSAGNDSTGRSNGSRGAGGDITGEEAQALATAAVSSSPHQQALYRMLLRQHRSIDTLAEVVKTQANTISSLVSMLGAGAAAAGGGGETARTSRAVPVGRAEAFSSAVPAVGANITAAGDCSASPPAASCSGTVDDVDAIAEMVAYLDDDATPAAAAEDAAATVMGT